MYKKLTLSALIVGSMISFAAAGRAMPVDSAASVPSLPVTKTGIICGPGMHLAGVVCVPNRRVVVVAPRRRVCPPGWHWGPAFARCVRN